MLVLSRTIGELISIGDAISVRVLSVSGSPVRLAVEAPGQVDVPPVGKSTEQSTR
ncbi:carbon storage regulator, partial [Pseudomonas fluorescens]|uniref:carbon storage regulator n=1 Tax=Pseudomonas fluorescens TaxID=294 RepID=UPI0009B769C3